MSDTFKKINIQKQNSDPAANQLACEQGGGGGGGRGRGNGKRKKGSCGMAKDFDLQMPVFNVRFKLTIRVASTTTAANL